MWITFAQSPLSMETILQLASAGGFALLSWYLIAKVIPEKDKEHRLTVERIIDEHRKERQSDQERWREERAEFRAYIAQRDARWIDYLEKLDKQVDEKEKDWKDIMIRMEALLLKEARNVAE